MVNWTPEELERWKADRQLAARRSQAGLPPLPVVATVTPGKRIRQDQKPLLNKLETEWLTTCAPGGTVTVRSQAKRYRLGNGIWYKPDFTASVFCPVLNQMVETAWEIKGPHAFRGGMENLKVAASTYPEIRWILCWKESGVWKMQIVRP